MSADAGLTLALVGRPNAGKSTLFNALTGGQAKVGNFPGVTVDALTGSTTLEDGRTLRVVDLPGVYSVASRSDPESDEGHALASLDALKGTPHVLAQVIDATQLAASLRLTKELLGRGQPLLLIVTQHDLLVAQGAALDAAGLREALGVPVVVVSAREPGLAAKLLQAVVDAARVSAEPAVRAFDEVALCARVLRRAGGPDALRRRTERLDAVLLHPVLGPVVFLALMTVLFGCVFLVSEPVSAAIDAATRWLAQRLEAGLGAGRLTSLVVDGVLGGAGTVLTFLPQIVVLTVVLELIEASGYLARCTFLVDRALRLVGLGGRSFVPLLTAHACAVPAIQATRIVREPGQRLRTILVLPLMTCSARIPTYGLLITAFLGTKSAWFKSATFVGLYVGGILAAFGASLLLGRTVKRAGAPRPLVLELPHYRRPQARVMARLAWRTAQRFVRDVGTVILMASVVLWGLLNVPGPGGAAHAPPPGASPKVVAMHQSLAASVGRALEPLTAPAGFDWRINVGLIGSFGARELMVGTMGVIFGIEDEDAEAPLAARLREAKAASGAPSYGVPTALSLMVFFMLACQCMSTLAAVRRETRSWRWAAFVIAYTYGLAYVLSVAVFQGSRWLLA